MAPSSTPYDASRRSLLAARDARQALLDRHLGAGRTLLALSLAVPGPLKTPPGADALFAWGACEVIRTFPGASNLLGVGDALGWLALWEVPEAAAEVKARCVAIETSRPAARLLDLDVYSPEGASVDRSALRLAPRPCLCCPEPARECIRAGRHGMDEVVAWALALLAGA